MNLKRFISKSINAVQNSQFSLETARDTKQLLIEKDLRSLKAELAQTIGASPIMHGFSVYSQNDEDGILENIFSKLEIQQPTFFEFGVSPKENNTNYLLLKGSRGCWIDKGLSGFKNTMPGNRKLKIFDEFVKLDNIISIMDQGCAFLDIPRSGIDLISLDLDGNDYYFIEKMVKEGVLPKIFCLEYNAVFPPAMDIKIKYSADHGWQQDDYFGCSLAAYANLLSPYYTLVSCNIPGSNCFFVLNSLIAPFTKYSIGALYQPPRYYHSPFNKAHAPSSRYVLDMLAS